MSKVDPPRLHPAECLALQIPQSGDPVSMLRAAAAPAARMASAPTGWGASIASAWPGASFLPISSCSFPLLGPLGACRGSESRPCRLYTTGFPRWLPVSTLAHRSLALSESPWDARFFGDRCEHADPCASRCDFSALAHSNRFTVSEFQLKPLYCFNLKWSD